MKTLSGLPLDALEWRVKLVNRLCYLLEPVFLFGILFGWLDKAGSWAISDPLWQYAVTTAGPCLFILTRYQGWVENLVKTKKEALNLMGDLGMTFVHNGALYHMSQTQAAAWFQAVPPPVDGLHLSPNS